MVLSLREVKQKHPELASMSDRALANKLHSEYYQKIPKDQFFQDIGLKPTRKATTGEFIQSLANPLSMPEEAEPTIPQSLGGAVVRKFGQTGRGLLQRLGIDEENSALEQQAFDQAQQKSSEVNPISTAAGGILGGLGEGVTAATLGGPILGMGALGGMQYTRPGESALKNAGIDAFLGAGFKYGGQAFKGLSNLNAKGLEKVGIPQKYAQKVAAPLATAEALYGGTELANRTMDTDLSPGKVAATGAALYAGGRKALPYVEKALGAAKHKIEKVKKHFTKTPEHMAEEILKVEHVSPEFREGMIDTAKARNAAAKESGFKGHLTPGEATGENIIIGNEEEFAKSSGGKGKMAEFWKNRVPQENSVVDKFFKLLGVDGKSVPADTSRKIRDTATEIITDQVSHRQKLAKPLYEKAYQVIVPKKIEQSLLEDEVVWKAAKNVYQNDAFREELKGVNKNSVKYWHNVQKFINKRIEAAEPTEARLLMKSKNKVRDALNKLSPDFKKAQAIFSSESDVLGELTKSNLGKLHKLPDSDLHKIGSILFNRQEIDPKTLNLVRSNLLKKNPKVFYDAVAQDMRLKMDTLAKKSSKRELPSLMNAIFKDDKTYNLYRDVLKHNPQALKRMEAIKVAFEDIATIHSPKATRALSKTNMNQSRNTKTAMFMDLFRSGNADLAGVEFITNPKWFDIGEKILRKPPGVARDIALGKLLNKIAQSPQVKKATELAKKHGAAAIQEPVRKGLNEQD